MKSKIHLLFTLLFFLSNTISAQRAEAEALLMQTQIKIGEQTELKFSVSYHEGTKKTKITWPNLKDTLSYGLEIIKIDTITTILINKSSVLYQQTRSVIITAFDSGTYVIPSQTFIINNDTVYTNKLLLIVTTVPIDTPIETTKYAILKWLGISGGFLLLMSLILFLYFRNKKNKSIPIESKIIAIPPHEKTLALLVALGQKKPWLHGELKIFHITLTEILRNWLVTRYQIHALELTTEEIINTLIKLQSNSDVTQKLQSILRKSDMVKFAKEVPDPEENENCLELAINFVKTTAIYNEHTTSPIQ
jgi:hypothetical protein